MGKNLKAFLDMLAISEIGQALLDVSDNGYNVLVGSTPSHPKLFDDYSTHPHILNIQLKSTAAGRYQVLARNYYAYKIILGLPDFSPNSQDLIAIRLITESHALDDVNCGRIKLAISKCAHIWASLPNANYGQHENSMDSLIKSYIAAGGSVSGV